MIKAGNANVKKKLNTATQQELRKNRKDQGLTEVVSYLDTYTYELLRQYCIELGYKDPGIKNVSKAATYSHALTSLIHEKLEESKNFAPKTPKAFELYRLRVTVRAITKGDEGMSDEAAAVHMTNLDFLRPKFVMDNAVPTREERAWTEKDIKRLKNKKKVLADIETLNKNPI